MIETELRRSQRRLDADQARVEESQRHRVETIRRAVEGGMTQVRVAEILGVRQPIVARLLARSKNNEGPGDGETSRGQNGDVTSDDNGS